MVEKEELTSVCPIAEPSGRKSFRINSLQGFLDHQASWNHRECGHFIRSCPLAPVVEANMIQQANLVVLMEIVTPDHRDRFRS